MRSIRHGWAMALVVLAFGVRGNFLHAAEDVAPEKLPASALTATLEKVGFMKDGGETIEADFVLKNGSKWPLRLAERWNSWGAYQWTFQMTNADGSVVEWRNPQMGWWRNYLSVATIPPGGELRLKCLLLWHQPRSQYEESTFVPTEKGARLLLPVKLRGVFSAKLEKMVPSNPPRLRVPVEREVVSTNWEGTIQTPEVVLERREAVTETVLKAAMGSGDEGFDQSVEIVAAVLNDKAHEREMRRVAEILATHDIEDTGFSSMGKSIVVPKERAAEVRALLAVAVKEESLDILILRPDVLRAVVVSPEEAIRDYETRRKPGAG